MGKLATALSLLARGDLARFRSQLRTNLCGWRVRRAQGRPFSYRLGGIPFVCLPGLSDSEEHYRMGDFDRVEMALMQGWLERGDAFVDVGANLGIYSFAASHFTQDSGIVLAIEASSELGEALRGSAQVLGVRNFTVVECAAGETAKEVVFYTASAGQCTGEQSLRPDPARLTGYVPRRVQMRTVADIVAQHSAAAQPAMVKLDIEGAEPLALSAVPPGWLGANGPAWIVEINTDALVRNGYSCAVLTGYFPAAHFECWLSPHHAFSGARTLPLRPLAGSEPFTDARFYNLIALPRGEAAGRRRRRIQSLLPTGNHGT